MKQTQFLDVIDRDEAERRHQGGHQNGTEADGGACADGLIQGECAAQLINGIDEDEAIQHGHAGEGNKSDGRGNRKRDVAQR